VCSIVRAYALVLFHLSLCDNTLFLSSTSFDIFNARCISNISLLANLIERFVKYLEVLCLKDWKLHVSCLPQDFSDPPYEQFLLRLFLLREGKKDVSIE
jgi:hypothetical protein